MNQHIDQVFKNGENQKDLALREGLWDRVERRLDDADHAPPPLWKRWMVAASLFLVFSLATLLILNIDRYKVEDMKIDKSPNFSKEEIAGLEEVYWVTPRIFVNPNTI